MRHPNFTLAAIVLCLATLGSSAAQDFSLRDDEAAIATNIMALYAMDSEVRVSAARQLRRIVAKYPSRTTNIRSKDGGEALWMEKVNRIGAGMTKTEAAKILPVFPEAPENSSIGSGQSHSVLYRLDYNWMVRIAYHNPDKVIERPTLIRRAFPIYVAPPGDYTGIWICWHVNGQKSFEIQFKEGKYDGVFTRFHDNGEKLVEQHYIGHVAEGTDTGWFPDGRVMYKGIYRNGKQDGRWVHFYHDGRQQSERNYKNGVQDGLSAGWYENGQMRFEMNYQNGVQHGIEAAWNKQGVLHYRREYKNGKVIE